MVAPNFIDVQGTGAKLDTTTVRQTTGTKELVHREVMVAGDPTDPLALGAVKDTLPSVSDYGTVVRPVGIPMTAFNQLDVAEATPQVQMKFGMGINKEITQTLMNNTSGGSSVVAANGLCTVTCAGAYPAFSQIRSMDTVRYGPGQGAVGLFTTEWITGGMALSSQWAGPGDDDEMLAFGWDNEVYSILHRSHGELEFRTLTITAGASGTGNLTITIDGTAVVVPVTSGDTIAQICAIIKAQEQDFQNAGRGWEVHTDDNISVEFISLVAENAAGVFSFAAAATGVTAGTFDQATTTVLGVAPTEVKIPQTEWNVDKMDGTGPSGVTMAMNITPGPLALSLEFLIPCKIAWQYLGGGPMFYYKETPSGDMQLVHCIRQPGSAALPSMRNPSLHMNIIIKTESGYSGSNIAAATASMAGFIQGKETLLGVRNSAHGQKSISNIVPQNVLTVHSELDWNGTRNKIDTYPDFLTLTNEVTKGVTVTLTINPTEVSGTVDLQPVDVDTTPIEYDTAGTLVIGGRRALIWDLAGGTAENIDLKPLDMFLRPGDRWVFSAGKLTSGGTAGVVGVGLTFLDRV